MFRKILTHFIILTLTALPVQLINASAENSSMKMSMQKLVQAEAKCMHTSNDERQQSTDVAASCCDDTSHQCDNCTHCPQVASALIALPVNYQENTPSLTGQKYLISHLLVNGFSQKNLLRPPRIII